MEIIINKSEVNSDYIDVHIESVKDMFIDKALPVVMKNRKNGFIGINFFTAEFYDDVIREIVKELTIGLKDIAQYRNNSTPSALQAEKKALDIRLNIFGSPMKETMKRYLVKEGESESVNNAIVEILKENITIVEFTDHIMIRLLLVDEVQLYYLILAKHINPSLFRHFNLSAYLHYFSNIVVNL